MPLRALSVTALALLGALSTAGTAHADPAGSYYVSGTGADSADGTTPATAWRTLARAQQQVLHPGDQLLLQGGTEFPGSLTLDARDGGTAAAPIVVSSYGAGRAVLAAAGGSGITVYDTGGVVLRHLLIKGTGAAGGGVNLYNDLPQRQSSVAMSDLDVSGFTNGIEVGGRPLGFADVTVADSVVHDNRDAGLVSYGPAFDAASPAYANAGISVLNVEAYRNSGNADNTTTNSGNGIVLGSVDGGSVVSSSAHDNGALCRAPQGPVGIWAYDANAVRIASSHSFGNRSGNGVDGDGFDLDQNVSHSVLEDNLSESNDGAGYLLYTSLTAGWAQHDNVLRHNRSVGDSRRNPAYGGITVAGRVLRGSLDGNTVDVTSSPVHAPALAVWAGVSGLTATGNTFLVNAGQDPVSLGALPAGAVTLSANTVVSPPVVAPPAPPAPAAAAQAAPARAASAARAAAPRRSLRARRTTVRHVARVARPRQLRR